MKGFIRRNRVVLTILAVLMAAALVWAAAELSGQADSMAQDAGDDSADMEMATLDSIKPPAKTKDSPKPPPCDWKLERKIKKEIDAEDQHYAKLRADARKQRQSGAELSDSTRTAILESGKKFNKLCEDYATMWNSCNCKTRAKTASDTGQSRIKSSEVLAGDKIDDQKLEEMQTAQTQMKDSRREYVQKATEDDEISAEDKQSVKADLVPRVAKMQGKAQTLVNRSVKLLNDVQSEIGGTTSGGTSGLIGGITKMASGDSVLTTLLGSVKSLVSAAQSMLSNILALGTDANALAGDTKGLPASEPSTPSTGTKSPGCGF